MLIGIPASGKSTWARAQGGTVLSSDEIRAMLCGDETNQTIHSRVFATMRYLLRQRLEIGASPTIVDATNLRRRDRKPWLKIAVSLGASVEAVHFDISLELALARNAARSRVVPEAAIRQMFLRLQPPQAKEGFSSIVTICESSTAKALPAAP